MHIISKINRYNKEYETIKYNHDLFVYRVILYYKLIIPNYKLIFQSYKVMFHNRIYIILLRHRYTIIYYTMVNIFNINYDRHFNLVIFY